MYGTKGIAREDRARRLAHFVSNWEFFGAPVAMIFSIDRQMQEGQRADLGGFLQSIMLLAREYGLHTCPQEAWAPFHEVIRAYLNVPKEEIIFCGMAVGYADEAAPGHTPLPERAPLGAWGV